MRHPPTPPQLAVGDDPETDLLLQADRRGDGAILDPLELGVVQRTGLMAASGIQELRAAQQTSDALGAHVHRMPPCSHRRRPPAAPIAIVTAVEAVVDCGNPASVLAMVCRLLDGTPRR
jgi:hypothetical protein